MTLPNGQKVVALDFDGVLHRYHGWNEGKLDVPISGMTHLVDLLMVKHGCHVVVHTTRAKDVVQTWLAKYGNQISAVWAANDDMALGALEALRAAGLAGKIPVVGVDGIPEAIDAVIKGEMLATVSSGVDCR